MVSAVKQKKKKKAATIMYMRVGAADVGLLAHHTKHYRQSLSI